MFRPYNLTSITAWTVGRLASNHAYYTAKRRSQGPKVSAASRPSNVSALIKKLERAQNETQTFVKAMAKSIDYAKQNKKFDVVPIIHMKVYNEWLQSRRNAFKDEARMTYEASMADGYIWSANVISDVQNEIDIFAEAFQGYVRNITDWFDGNFQTEALPQEVRQQISDVMKERQKNCCVDEATCKIIDSKDGRILINHL
jgi:hypothetical protein